MFDSGEEKYPEQWRSNEVEQIAKLLRENESDPAYLASALAEALDQVADECSGTAHSEAIAQCARDVRRLRQKWMKEYPAFVLMVGGRR